MKQNTARSGGQVDDNIETITCRDLAGSPIASKCGLIALNSVVEDSAVVLIDNQDLNLGVSPPIKQDGVEFDVDELMGRVDEDFRQAVSVNLGLRPRQVEECHDGSLARSGCSTPDLFARGIVSGEQSGNIKDIEGVGGEYFDGFLHEVEVTDCEPAMAQRWLINTVPTSQRVQARALEDRQPPLLQET